MIIIMIEIKAERNVKIEELIIRGDDPILAPKIEGDIRGLSLSIIFLTLT
jgi:hypothetical protein